MPPWPPHLYCSIMKMIPTDTIHFYSPRSGDLSVKRQGEFLTLNFPADPIKPIDLSEAITDGFNIKPTDCFKGKTDYLLIFKNERDIINLSPDLDLISKLKCRGIIATAKGDHVDFVSRFFAPQSGINEDPVTGSAHTTLIPYWAKQMDKYELTAM